MTRFPGVGAEALGTLFPMPPFQDAVREHPRQKMLGIIFACCLAVPQVCILQASLEVFLQLSNYVEREMQMYCRIEFLPEVGPYALVAGVSPKMGPCMLFWSGVFLP